MLHLYSKGKHKGLFELFKEGVTNAISLKKRRNNTLRAAVSKLLFPHISTTIVSQEIFSGLDELLPFLIFWVKENQLFFFLFPFFLHCALSVSPTAG